MKYVVVAEINPIITISDRIINMIYNGNDVIFVLN